MASIVATDITAVDWARFGTLYDLTGGETTGNTNASEGDGWRDVCTNQSVLDTLGSIGMTVGSPVPFTCSEMERHLHTEEAQIPAGKAICLLLAPPSENPPSAEDLVPIIIRPGYIFVINRGVWHSASHGVEPDTPYYWMAEAYEGEPTEWASITGGPVKVALE
jgi:ureidoglycolate hydrolase